MSKKDVLFLLPYPLHKAPSQRFRVENFLFLLDEANIKYDLSFEKFCELINNECFYCGQKPNTIWSSHRKKENKIIYNGIDRKNNNLGYSEENTVSCCKFCNIAKKAHPLSLWKEKVKAWNERVDSW
jgi:hypothetical protein